MKELSELEILQKKKETILKKIEKINNELTILNSQIYEIKYGEIEREGYVNIQNVNILLLNKDSTKNSKSIALDVICHRLKSPRKKSISKAYYVSESKTLYNEISHYEAYQYGYKIYDYEFSPTFWGESPPQKFHFDSVKFVFYKIDNLGSSQDEYGSWHNYNVPVYIREDLLKANESNRYTPNYVI